MKNWKQMIFIGFLVILATACTPKKSETQGQTNTESTTTEVQTQTQTILSDFVMTEVIPEQTIDEPDEGWFDLSGELVKYTKDEAGEVWISVLSADESFFKTHTTYHSFIRDEPFVQKIAFIPNVPVKDFTWFAAIVDFDDSNDKNFYRIRELYRVDELGFQKPLVVSWVEVGSMSCFAFSYRDKDGQTNYFIGVVYYDMESEDYTRPLYLISRVIP